MHEISLMQHALERVAAHAARIPGGRVTTVRLRIGRLSGVVPEALEFAFQALTPGTVVEGGRLEMEHIPVVAYCSECRSDVRMEHWPCLCPECGSPALEVRHGGDFELVSIEVESDV